jgi:hypothetical protein
MANSTSVWIAINHEALFETLLGSLLENLQSSPPCWCLGYPKGSRENGERTPQKRGINGRRWSLLGSPNVTRAVVLRFDLGRGYICKEIGFVLQHLRRGWGDERWLEMRIILREDIVCKDGVR